MLALPVGTAAAQSAPAPPPAPGDSPFAPLPQPQPTQPPAPAPQPAPAGSTDDDGPSDRSMLALGGVGIAVILAIGWLIGRDARRSLPRGHRPKKADEKPPRPESPKVRRGHPAGRRNAAAKAAPAAKRRAKKRAR